MNREEVYTSEIQSHFIDILKIRLGQKFRYYSPLCYSLLSIGLSFSLLPD